jgi:assimilatory nitrate reductase catalytic subunit
VNALTTGAFCPRSKQPELKHAAVKVLKAELPWGLLALAWLPDASALRARQALAELLPRFAFASCVPFGRERSGVLLRAAAYEAAPEALLEAIEAQLGLAAPDILRYADRRRGQRRSVLLAGHGEAARIEAFLLAGDTSAESWMRPLLQDERPVDAHRRLLLRPGTQGPAARSRGRQVCSCFDVTEAEIEAALTDGVGAEEAERLARVQAATRCGTNCGSCLPELKRLLRRSALAAA